MDPIFFLAEFMTEEDVSREDVERIHQARSEEYALTRVPRWIGRELTLSQFQDGMTFIQKMQCLFDLLEDPDAVVRQDHLSVGGRLCNLDVKFAGAGMIDRVIEHFGEAKVPDVHDVLWQLPEHERDIPAPYLVFLQRRRNVV